MTRSYSVGVVVLLGLISSIGLSACEGASGKLEVRPPSCFLAPSRDGRPLGTSEDDMWEFLKSIASPTKGFNISSPELIARFGEVSGDTKVIRDLQFVVRVVRADGEPLKNTLVNYSYVRKATTDYPKLVAFTEQLQTDTDGYVTLPAADAHQVLMTSAIFYAGPGNELLNLVAMIEGKTSEVSNSSIFSLAPLEGGIPFAFQGEFSGKLSVPGAAVGQPNQVAVEAALTSSEADDVSLGQKPRYIRLGYITDFNAGENCTSSESDPESCGRWDIIDEIRENGMFYRNTLDSSFTCNKFNEGKGESFDDFVSVNFQDAKGNKVECGAIEALVPAMNCNQDWQRTVYEVHTI